MAKDSTRKSENEKKGKASRESRYERPRLTKHGNVKTLAQSSVLGVKVSSAN